MEINRRTLLKSTGLLTLGFLAPGALVSAAKGIAIEGNAAVVPTPSASTPLLLNYNENSLGMSPTAMKVAQNALSSAAYRYPDAERAALISALASANGLTDKHISLGNGSSELIRAVVNGAAVKNGQLITATPTFGSAEDHAKPLNVNVVKVRLTSDHLLDIAKMKAAADAYPGFSLVYLCNPNNPTGTITPAKVINEWISNAPDNVMFVLDEAYHDYVTDPRYESGVSWVKKGKKNVIVLRTFSKIHALAGLRMGYALAHPETAAWVDGFCSYDNSNVVAATAAKASLADTAWIKYSQNMTSEARKITVDALNRLNLEYMPSQANFIMHRVKGSTADYQKAMRERHVMVGRPFEFTDGWNRLTLGTPGEMQAFVKVLDQLRQAGLV